MKEFVVYTDGGCSHNPGPGAWAFLIRYGERLYEDSGFEAETTNNRMELMAVIRALNFLQELRANYVNRNPSPGLEKEPSAGERTAGLPSWFFAPVSIYTDSQYVRNGITKWIEGWKARGWHTASKNPVKNQELWETLDSLVQILHPRFFWVEGHAGNPDNERCDMLVRSLIKSKAP
ncbi:MAG: ribonuclease H [Rectinema sp.]